MKKFLLIGTGVLFLAGTGAAFAQMPPNGPGGDEDHMGPPHGPHMMEMMHHHWEQMHHEEDNGAMAGGAAFRFRRGDMEIGIKCAEEEPTFVCVRAAGMLLDKLNGANGINNTSTSPSSSPGTTGGGTTTTPNGTTAPRQP